MLTKQDLQALGSLVEEKIKPIEKEMQDVKNNMHSLGVNITNMNSDVRKIKNDVSILIERTDREDVRLLKRIEKLEQPSN